MSWISDTFRGAMAERPPSDLRLSVSWIRPADGKKENLKFGSSKIAFPFLRWTGFIIYLEVPNCLELNFSLCFLDNGEGGTTVQIYPAQITKSVWIEDHMKGLLCWFKRFSLPDLFNLQPVAPDPLQQVTETRDQSVLFHTGDADLSVAQLHRFPTHLLHQHTLSLHVDT